MPLRYQIMVAIIWVLGVGIGFFLLWRILAVLRKRKFGALFFRSLLLLAYLGLAYSLSYVFLPWFNPLHPVLSRGGGPEQRLVLTFDDGPNEPYTSAILDILKQEGVTATFFLLGEKIEKNPEVVRRMLREGHQIGNHTYSHRALITLDSEEIEREIEGWERAAASLGGRGKWFRAPHGWKVPWLYPILERKGYRLVAWTRGVWDTDAVDENVLFQRLTEGLRPGEIILLHDGVDTRAAPDRSQLVKALPRVFRHYREQGYRIVPLSEVAH